MQETCCDADNKQFLFFSSVWFLVCFFFKVIDTSDGGSVMSDCGMTWIKKLNKEVFLPLYTRQ